MRPTIAISPSRSASSVVPRSITGRDRLVDVVAVAPGTDVALRVEGRPAQRTRRPPRTHDPRRARHERTGRVGGHPHPQEVGAVLVFVVVLVGVDLLAVFGLGASLDQDALGVAVPAKRQRTGAKRLVQWLVEGSSVDGG